MTEAARPSSDIAGNGEPAPAKGPEEGKPRTGAPELQPLPIDRVSPQFTLRAVLTGMVLGAVFSAANIYAGLKLGLVFNMSIVAAVVSFGFWEAVYRASGRQVRAWGILENNINQTACSSGASVAAAGLIAPIPALAIVTGQTLDWYFLALWVFSVCLVGITVAVGLRRQLLLADKLPFPVGVASAETLREIHARGREALRQVLALATAAGLAAAVQAYQYVCGLLSSGWALRPLHFPLKVKGLTLQSLTFALNPSPLLLAVGGLIGPRASASLLVGAVFAFGVVAPPLVNGGTIAAANFGAMVEWLVWPGVTLMVVSALVSFAFSWRSMAAALLAPFRSSDATGTSDIGEVGRNVFIGGLVLALVLSVALQVSLFAILWWAAVGGVVLSFALALVAARVSGETGINPVAALGKVTQVTLAGFVPQSPAANLMSANVTAGAASQCADLLDDLKCGHILGASPRLQWLAQLGGALAGALAGSAAYVLLIRDPAAQLLTQEWPAPGVRGMKAVAELFQDGFAALPPGTPLAMLIAAGVAVVLALIEKLVPKRVHSWTLSPASIGLAFVFPASVSLTIFVGGMIALALRKQVPNWTTRFLITICAGIVAGDTLTGVGTGIHRLFYG